MPLRCAYRRETPCRRHAFLSDPRAKSWPGTAVVENAKHAGVQLSIWHHNVALAADKSRRHSVEFLTETTSRLLAVRIPYASSWHLVCEATSRPMRILFIGGTKRGYLTLAALLKKKNDQDVVGVFSLRQDAQEIERYEDAIRDLATRCGIAHYESRSLKERDYADIIAREIRPDVALVIGCRILLPRAIFEAPPLGTLAVHDSLLPAYRGFAPLNWCIINGESQTGVTLFYLNDCMDAGDIVGQRVVPIGQKDTAPAVYERVCQATIDLVLETMPLLAGGKAPRQPQEEARATFACSRNPEDGLIEWLHRTVDIHNLVRALTRPYPGAFTFYLGRRLTILCAEPVRAAECFVGRIPGRVVAVSGTDGWVDVLTGDGVLRLFEVQEESGEPVAAASVIRSVRATLGLRPLDLLTRIQRLEQEVESQRGALAMAPAAP